MRYINTFEKFRINENLWMTPYEGTQDIGKKAEMLNIFLTKMDVGTRKISSTKFFDFYRNIIGSQFLPKFEKEVSHISQLLMMLKVAAGRKDEKMIKSNLSELKDALQMGEDCWSPWINFTPKKVDIHGDLIEMMQMFDLCKNKETGKTEQTKYNVTASAKPRNAGITTGTGRYSEGDKVTVTARPKPGYKFKYWTETGSANSFSTSMIFKVGSRPYLSLTISKKDRYLVAVFEPKHNYAYRDDDDPPPPGGAGAGRDDDDPPPPGGAGAGRDDDDPPPPLQKDIIGDDDDGVFKRSTVSEILKQIDIEPDHQELIDLMPNLSKLKVYDDNDSWEKKEKNRRKNTKQVISFNRTPSSETITHELLHYFTIPTILKYEKNEKDCTFHEEDYVKQLKLLYEYYIDLVKEKDLDIIEFSVGITNKNLVKKMKSCDVTARTPDNKKKKSTVYELLLAITKDYLESIK